MRHSQIMYDDEVHLSFHQLAQQGQCKMQCNRYQDCIVSSDRIFNYMQLVP